MDLKKYQTPKKISIFKTFMSKRHLTSLINILVRNVILLKSNKIDFQN